MAPTLICIRHAQGYHNLGSEYHSLQDPRLTDLGQQQCTTLRDSGIIDHSKISLITASPLTRTIHTAYLSLTRAFDNGKCQPKIIALPDAQETSDFPCDTGSDVDVLQKRCEDEDWPVDLTRVPNDWNVKTPNSRYSPAGDKLRIRAQAARQQIRQLMRDLVSAGDEDAQVVLVSHGGYLHYFTDDWEDSNKYLGTGWANTETRFYTYSAGVDSDEADASLAETTESRSRRGKSIPMFAKDKQEELFQSSHAQWESQGLINALKIKSQA